MDLAGLLGGGGSTSKEFGSSTAANTINNNPTFNRGGNSSPNWVYPALIGAGALLLFGLVLVALKKL